MVNPNRIKGVMKRIIGMYGTDRAGGWSHVDALTDVVENLRELARTTCNRDIAKDLASVATYEKVEQTVEVAENTCP